MDAQDDAHKPVRIRIITVYDQWSGTGVKTVPIAEQRNKMNKERAYPNRFEITGFRKQPMADPMQ